MTMCISCEHGGNDHWMGVGRCSGMCFDDELDSTYTCLCVRYERDTDE